MYHIDPVGKEVTIRLNGEQRTLFEDFGHGAPEITTSSDFPDPKTRVAAATWRRAASKVRNWTTSSRAISPIVV
ncbi:MAG: hypothetical protein U5K56_09905 [Halioglobus sp.]|nr:hypothetical protein [Halioglobus sp.]